MQTREFKIKKIRKIRKIRKIKIQKQNPTSSNNPVHSLLSRPSKCRFILLFNSRVGISAMDNARIQKIKEYRK